MENVAGPQSLASHGKFFQTPGAATLNTVSPIEASLQCHLVLKLRFNHLTLLNVRPLYHFKVTSNLTLIRRPGYISHDCEMVYCTARSISA